MNCSRCGAETDGTYNEGGLLTAVCSSCDYSEQQERQQQKISSNPYVMRSRLPKFRMVTCHCCGNDFETDSDLDNIKCSECDADDFEQWQQNGRP